MLAHENLFIFFLELNSRRDLLSLRKKTLNPQIMGSMMDL